MDIHDKSLEHMRAVRKAALKSSELSALNLSLSALLCQRLEFWLLCSCSGWWEGWRPQGQLCFHVGTHCKVQTRTGRAQANTEQLLTVEFVQDSAITHLFFWKSQGICSSYSQEKLISGRMKWAFSAQVSSVEQLIKSESLSLHQRKYKANENNCTVSASCRPRFGQGIKFQLDHSCVCEAGSGENFFLLFIFRLSKSDWELLKNKKHKNLTYIFER